MTPKRPANDIPYHRSGNPKSLSDLFKGPTLFAECADLRNIRFVKLGSKVCRSYEFGRWQIWAPFGIGPKVSSKLILWAIMILPLRRNIPYPKRERRGQIRQAFSAGRVLRSSLRRPKLLRLNCCIVSPSRSSDAGPLRR